MVLLHMLYQYKILWHSTESPLVPEMLDYFLLFLVGLILSVLLSYLQSG
jgi:hypothetical protein